MSNATVVEEPVSFDPMEKLTKDLKAAARLLKRKEARFLVDQYYQIQDYRIRSAAQARANVESGEPNQLIVWNAEQTRRLEYAHQSALKAFVESYTVGVWLQSICGIGPIISAGLLAHIDITKAPTFGHIWRFAGFDPTTKWEKGTKRPWNADLKCLVAFKAGESFVKQQNNDKDVYGKLFRTRKDLEIEKNENGLFSADALRISTEKNIGKDTDAYLWYNGCLTKEAAQSIRLLDSSKREGAAKKMAGEPRSGVFMLPPSHIHARARRYAVKLFLSHLHHAMFLDYYDKEPPNPYVFEHGVDHRHYIAPPNLPFAKIEKSLRELN